jgi:uncharacterized lipoprotein
MRIAGILLAAVLVAVATGCKTRTVSCKQDNKAYVGAQEAPPLKAPPGLEEPNTRNALKVPQLDTPERIRGKNEPCLDAPPPFAAPKVAAPPSAPAKPGAAAAPDDRTAPDNSK